MKPPIRPPVGGPVEFALAYPVALACLSLALGFVGFAFALAAVCASVFAVSCSIALSPLVGRQQAPTSIGPLWKKSVGMLLSLPPQHISCDSSFNKMWTVSLSR